MSRYSPTTEQIRDGWAAVAAIVLVRDHGPVEGPGNDADPGYGVGGEHGVGRRHGEHDGERFGESGHPGWTFRAVSDLPAHQLLEALDIAIRHLRARCCEQPQEVYAGAPPLA